jgi:dihydrofolate reductase
MRRLIYSMLVSLDGFMETADGGIGWTIPDEELHSFANNQARESGVFLYGRRLYQVMADFWPTADTDPAAPWYVVEFARIWRDKPKVVFSTTLEQVGWNSRLARGDLGAEITALKEQPGDDIAIGGATLAAEAVRLGLVDEFHLLVHPVVLGGGKPFFPDLPDPVNLRLLDNRRFDSGVVYLRYER